MDTSSRSIAPAGGSFGSTPLADLPAARTLIEQLLVQDLAVLLVRRTGAHIKARRPALMGFWFVVTPAACGSSPVSIDCRDGQQTGALQ